MAEPGRAISAPGMTLVTRVIGRAKRQDETWWFYLDDGDMALNRDVFSITLTTR